MSYPPVLSALMIDVRGVGMALPVAEIWMVLGSARSSVEFSRSVGRWRGWTSSAPASRSLSHDWQTGDERQGENTDSSFEFHAFLRWVPFQG